jgi:hypothetical protein
MRLAASPQLVRLGVLRLAGSLITDEVVDTLVASATLAGLRHLDSQNCVFITTNGAERLRARFGRRLRVGRGARSPWQHPLPGPQVAASSHFDPTHEWH